MDCMTPQACHMDSDALDFRFDDLDIDLDGAVSPRGGCHSNEEAFGANAPSCERFQDFRHAAVGAASMPYPLLSKFSGLQGGQAHAHAPMRHDVRKERGPMHYACNPLQEPCFTVTHGFQSQASVSLMAACECADADDNDSRDLQQRFSGSLEYDEDLFVAYDAPSMHPWSPSAYDMEEDDDDRVFSSITRVNSGTASTCSERCSDRSCATFQSQAQGQGQQWREDDGCLSDGSCGSMRWQQPRCRSSGSHDSTSTHWTSHASASMSDCASACHTIDSGSDTKASRSSKRKNKRKAFSASPLPATTRTVIMRNIPNRMHQDELLMLVHEQDCHWDMDFFYLPMDRRTLNNLGYAFINFKHPAGAERFFQVFDTWRLAHVAGVKVVSVQAAHQQGLDALRRHFANARVMRQSDLRFRPLFEQDIARTVVAASSAIATTPDSPSPPASVA